MSTNQQTTTRERGGPVLGAHMSIAGGYYRAVEAAATAGCDCVQVFTKNNNQWRARPIPDDEARRFQDKLAELGIVRPLSHASYLINLASPDPTLRSKSQDALVIELQRAARLGIANVVVHPGSFTTSDEASGIAAIIQSLNRVTGATADLPVRVLLENTAGQGSNLGWQFEQLAGMLDGLDQPERVGICIDTCHAFAAGYPLADPEGYAKTIGELDRLLGLPRVHAFHLNDSKQPFGSRKDRHENIGQGEMGLEPFRNLLNDPRFRDVPMYLETPKGQQAGRDLDVVNLETLRLLVE